MLIDLKHLFQKYHIQSKGILHCGANKAQELQSYLDNGIEEVIWVEAIKEVYNELNEIIKPYPKQIALNACVSNENYKTVVFNISNNECQSSSMFELGEHEQLHPTVKYVRTEEMKTIRLDKLLSNYDMRSFDFLNFDLQGAELLALKGMGAMLSYFNYCYLEINKRETYKGAALIGEVESYLNGYGFVRVETSRLVGGCWGDCLFIHKSKL